MDYYRQNDPIYSDDPAEEELAIEYWSRFDYVREAYGSTAIVDHGEDPDDYPPQDDVPMPAGPVVSDDDEIPF